MTSRWDELSSRQLFELLRASGEPELREYLIEKHEGLVRHVAREYADSGEDYEDLVSVGHIGLINAIDRYDPSRGTKFATFAVPTIKGEIRRYFRDMTWAMRVPRRLQELSTKARAAEQQLTQHLRRSPTYSEVASELGVSREQVIEAMEVGQQYDWVSIDDGGGQDDEGNSYIERTGEDDPGLHQLVSSQETAEYLERLPTREKVILVMRFFLDMSQDAVGERLGISQMHVSRLQQRALHRLRNMMETR
jgi:RNA polymerase sigma-B factor